MFFSLSELCMFKLIGIAISWLLPVVFLGFVGVFFPPLGNVMTDAVLIFILM